MDKNKDMTHQTPGDDASVNKRQNINESSTEDFRPVTERADEDVARADDEEASQEELREKGLDLGRNRTQ